MAGLWRAYAFNSTQWAVEPVTDNEDAAQKRRTYHDTLEEALRTLYRKTIGEGAKGALQGVLIEIKKAEDAIRHDILRYAESLRLAGLALVSEDG